MNHLQKHLSASLIALAALTVAPMAAWAATAPSLGTASGYSVVGGTAVTASSSTITGDVASATAISLTTSTITGNLVYNGAITVTPPSAITGTTTQSATVPAAVVGLSLIHISEPTRL